MATLNKYAAAVMKDYDVHACSDITGYGLLGHGLEMTLDGNVSIVFEAAPATRVSGHRRTRRGRRQTLNRRLQAQPRVTSTARPSIADKRLRRPRRGFALDPPRPPAAC